jgi:DNA-binding transcriptional regulator YhcF (GntR family)
MNKEQASTTRPEENLSRNEKKWGPTIWRAGWTAVPSVLLDKQHALNLEPVDLTILLQLFKRWWYADNPPYPSKEEIATAIGKSPKTVQRRLKYMEELGYLTRRKRPGPFGTNTVSFEGLVRRLDEYAQEATEQREAQTQANKERLRRKRPRLHSKQPE